MSETKWDKSEAALKTFLNRLKSQGWKKHERDAAEGGWGYVLDMCSTQDGYDLKQMNDGDGGCEAYDIADSLVLEKRESRSREAWKGPKDKESAADCVHAGISAATKYIRANFTHCG